MRRFIARSHLTMVLALLLLVPLGGVAAGKAVSSPGAKGCATGSSSSASLTAFDSTTAFCVVDQYGNSYSFSKDPTDPQGNYLIGTATNNQGCAPSWLIMGSYVQKNGIQLELTAVNPDPTTCIPAYKLKGTYPNAAWYYTYGYGAQEFTYTNCVKAHKPAHPVTKGGAWGL